jgi:hypothetical protein
MLCGYMYGAVIQIMSPISGGNAPNCGRKSHAIATFLGGPGECAFNPNNDNHNVTRMNMNSDHALGISCSGPGMHPPIIFHASVDGPLIWDLAVSRTAVASPTPFDISSSVPRNLIVCF